jgi:hypothetical protein
MRRLAEVSEKAAGQFPAHHVIMPKYFAARIVIASVWLIVFHFGIAALRSGEIRSGAYKFNRDDHPVGYWFTVLVHLVGPVAIIFVILTR